MQNVDGLIRSYNQKGQLTSVQYYDANGALVNISEGYAKLKYIYDDSGMS